MFAKFVIGAGSQVDRPHASFAELTQNLVLTDALAGLQLSEGGRFTGNDVVETLTVVLAGEDKGLDANTRGLSKASFSP